MTLEPVSEPDAGTAVGRRHSGGIPDFKEQRDQLLEELAEIVDETRLQYAVNQLAVFDKEDAQRAALAWLRNALEHPERVASRHQGKRYRCQCHGSGMVLLDATDGVELYAPCHRCNPEAFARFEAEHPYYGNHLHCPRPDKCETCKKVTDPTVVANQGWAV